MHSSATFLSLSKKGKIHGREGSSPRDSHQKWILYLSGLGSKRLGIALSL